MFNNAEKLKAEIAALQKRKLLGALLCLAPLTIAFCRQYLGIMGYFDFSGPLFWLAAVGSVLVGLYLILSTLDSLRQKQLELNKMFASPGRLG